MIKSAKKKQKNDWSKIENHQKYFDNIFITHNLNSFSDWNQISTTTIKKEGGGGLLQFYKGKLSSALQKIYPNYPWSSLFSSPSHFTRKFSKNYLNNRETLHKTIQELSNHFQINSPDDWNKLSNKEIKKTKIGRTLLSKFRGNLLPIIKELHPTFEWNLTMKTRFPQRFWQSKENQIFFIEEILLPRLNLNSILELKNFSVRKIQSHGGSTLLKYYQNSVFLMLKKLYPNISWNPFLFHSLPHYFWKEKENQILFFEYLFKKLKLKEMKDWYNVSLDQIFENGGGGLINNSPMKLFELLKTVYPNFDWNIQFSKSRKNEVIKDRSVLSILKSLFDVRKREDWYRISNPLLLFSQYGGSVLYSGGLNKYLEFHYPSFNWKKSKFISRQKKSSQRWLFICLSRLFTNHLLIEDYLSASFSYSATGGKVQMDVFVPGLNMAFEYQGSQHYNETIGGFSPIETYSQRDHEKKILLKIENIFLIEIPYWWDNSPYSLPSFILSHFLKSL